MKDCEHEFLLVLARKSIEFYLATQLLMNIEEPSNPEMLEDRAVFITLTKDGVLRGCIGHMQARMPLYEAVIEMAADAAFDDPRFPEMTAEELTDIKIEISILSPMKRLCDYQKIRLGIDGVLLKKGFRSGVFLPQVATETGWDLDTFLGNLCSHKAGLAYNAYKKPETEIFVFQVVKFREM